MTVKTRISRILLRCSCVILFVSFPLWLASVEDVFVVICAIGIAINGSLICATVYYCGGDMWAAVKAFFRGDV